MAKKIAKPWNFLPAKISDNKVKQIIISQDEILHASNSCRNRKWEEWKSKKYLETATQFYAEEIQNLNDIKNGEKRNLFIETTGANEGLIVENKITFEVIDVSWQRIWKWLYKSTRWYKNLYWQFKYKKDRRSTKKKKVLKLKITITVITMIITTTKQWLYKKF